MILFEPIARKITDSCSELNSTNQWESKFKLETLVVGVVAVLNRVYFVNFVYRIEIDSTKTIVQMNQRYFTCQEAHT